MKRMWLERCLGVVSLAMAFGFLGACDNGPNTDALDNYFEEHPFVSDPRANTTQLVTVSPTLATVSTVGGQAVFRASGGNGRYHWDVSQPGVGTVSPTDGDTTTYTALGVGANDVVVYDSDGEAGLATISGSVPANFYVTASASPTSLASDGDLSVLEASGGIPTYVWTVTDVTKGNVTPSATGQSVLYKRYAPGDNGITVTDGRGNTASLVIAQP